MESIKLLGIRVKKAAGQLVGLNTDQKNEALGCIAEAIDQQRSFILEENSQEVERNEKEGMSKALLDRLLLTDARVDGMLEGIKQVQELPDPVGVELDSRELGHGLLLRKVRVPIGAVGIIYEARPNVTLDASVLCLKAGNSVLLRGSSSAIRSNKALVKVIRAALEQSAVPADAVLLIEDTRRETVEELLRLKDFVDVIIPRGGAGLINYVVENASVPVLETGAGVCHVYVDAAADVQMAKSIVINAKTQRPSVCNAAETLLIHQDWGSDNIKGLITALQEKEVECRGCPQACQLLPELKPAVEEDWGTEYLDYIITVKVVANLDEAVGHINQYGTRHSEAIVTEDKKAAERFMCYVDASSVYHNASTRFTDGFEFGFGAEIGISTQKLHARGPMGLPELTSYKYLVFGSGQIRG